MRIFSVLFVLILAVSPTFGQSNTSPALPPAWVLSDLQERLGRWTADNAGYRSEAELFESYVLEWKQGVGRYELVGHLYGLIDEAVVDTFWSFRQFWHPGRKELILMQFGVDGTVGEGVVRARDDGMIEADQIMYGPDGSTWRTGHRQRIVNDKEQSWSYNIDDQGVWHEERFYLWVKR